VGMSLYDLMNAEREITKLTAKNAMLVAMLRRLEWFGQPPRMCPCCIRFENEDHARDCELARLLK
jgi:hypothetical protein